MTLPYELVMQELVKKFTAKAFSKYNIQQLRIIDNEGGRNLTTFNEKLQFLKIQREYLKAEIDNHINAYSDYIINEMRIALWDLDTEIEAKELHNKIYKERLEL